MAKADTDEKKPRKKKPSPNDERVIIRARTTHDWSDLLKKARKEHWRRIQVTIQIREWLLAGKPADLDAAIAMLKARSLEDQIEAVSAPVDALIAGASEIEDPHLRAQAAERVADNQGLCEFSRRPGRPGLWIPANNIKAGFKENWSVLGKTNDVRGSRKAIAEGVFIFCANSWDLPSAERDWIKVGEEGDQKIVTSVSHNQGPKGPTSSIKRNEYVVRPIISYDMYIARFAAVEDKLSDDDIAKALIHFQEHGLGASRSQGYGKHDILEIRPLEDTNSTPASDTVPAAPKAEQSESV